MALQAWAAGDALGKGSHLTAGAAGVGTAAGTEASEDGGAHNSRRRWSMHSCLG